jgi:hypothetical protein
LNETPILLIKRKTLKTKVFLTLFTILIPYANNFMLPTLRGDILRLHIFYCLFAALFLFTACDDTGGSTNIDAGPDVDADMDSGQDVVEDADIDAQPDGSIGKPANVDSPLAINLGSVNYYSRQWTFLDQTKHGSSFGYAATPGGFDDSGWVTSGDGGLFLNTGLDHHYPGGRYVVTYDGEAEFFTRETIWDAGGNGMPNDAVLNEGESSPGHLVLDVTPSNNGFVLSFQNISTSNPVTSITIVPEEHQSSHEEDIFHPQFIESIKRFSTLRFMDMMRTNNSGQGQWAERPLTTDAFQGTDRGVALEYLIALANRVHANPWFNIPHLADDYYVQNFAAMVRDSLDPELQVYVEYSNEVWNGGFEQYEYARIQGEAQSLGTDRDAVDRFYIRRSVEIFGIFETVFSETGRTGPVRVIASQNSPYWALRMMDWQDPDTNTRGIDYADYWALAPYFCGNPPDSPGSVEVLLELCQADITDTLTNAKEIGDGARVYGVELIAYEGGQHIRNDAADQSAQDIYDLANDNVRMGELYTLYLNQWREDLGQMFTLFSLISGQSVYGRWGILKAQDDFTYPKYSATMEWITNNPVWW